MKSDYARAFAVAVAREINAERARQNIDSIRAFAKMLGDSNHTSWTKKLSPHLGKFTPMTTGDLALAARALKVSPAEIMRRAQTDADWTVVREREQVRAEQIAARALELSPPEKSAHTTESA